MSANAERLRHRVYKAAGDTIENTGSILTGIVRLVQDVHDTQAPYSNGITEPVPVLRTLVRWLNTGVSAGLGGLRYGAKKTVKEPGGKLVDYAATKKDEFKEEKSRRIAERKEMRKREKENESVEQ